MAQIDFEKQCETHLNWMESLLEDAPPPPQIPTISKLPKSQPKLPTKPQKEEIQYRISDINDDSYSEDDSECEEYYVEDAKEIHGKAIPSWARAANLINELQAQASLDPDTIFYGFPNTCDLNVVFNQRNASFKIRGDSGMWTADKLTPEEIQNYKKAVGFA